MLVQGGIEEKVAALVIIITEVEIAIIIVAVVVAQVALFQVAELESRPFRTLFTAEKRVAVTLIAERAFQALAGYGQNSAFSKRA